MEAVASDLFDLFFQRKGASLMILIDELVIYNFSCGSLDRFSHRLHIGLYSSVVLNLHFFKRYFSSLPFVAHRCQLTIENEMAILAHFSTGLSM